MEVVRQLPDLAGVVNSKWKFVITPGTFRLVSGERRIRFDMVCRACHRPCLPQTNAIGVA